MSIVKELLKQVFSKPFTNPFPVKRAPNKLSDIKKVNDPIPVPPDFRGKIHYDREKCIGCKMCVQVCPSGAMVFNPSVKKIRHQVLRCTMCGFCVEVCPVKALSQSTEFLLAESDKKSKNLVEK